MTFALLDRMKWWPTEKPKEKNRKFINTFLSDPLGNKGHSLKDFATPA